MESRTYIQMALDKNRAGKLPISKPTIRLFELYCSYMEGNPELQEKVINGRVKSVKAIRDFYYPFNDFEIPAYQLELIELILIAYYTDHKLAYVPARGMGWSMAHKLITIMFYGNVFDNFDTSKEKEIKDAK